MWSHRKQQRVFHQRLSSQPDWLAVDWHRLIKNILISFGQIFPICTSKSVLHFELYQNPSPDLKSFVAAAVKRLVGSSRFCRIPSGQIFLNFLIYTSRKSSNVKRNLHSTLWSRRWTLIASKSSGITDGHAECFHVWQWGPSSLRTVHLDYLFWAAPTVLLYCFGLQVIIIVLPIFTQSGG